MKTPQDFGDLGEGGREEKGGMHRRGGRGRGEGGEGGKRRKAVGGEGWGKEVKGISIQQVLLHETD